MIGTRVGAYEVLALLGEGGMGAVYRARDTRLKRDVAIKVLLPEVAGDPERLARFQREAELLAALNHPNIAHLYGLEGLECREGQESPGPFLVMELVEGPTLADVIADARSRPALKPGAGSPKSESGLPLADALAIARQIAEALEAAHDAGIIHRDLKPSNIKVRDDGTVKVLDFGLAKAVEQPGRPGMPGEPGHTIPGPPGSPGFPGLTHSPTLTSPVGMTGVGVLLGTAAYMSPEQAKGRPADKRADIWAFGCVLFEMLTCARAFGGDDLTDTLAAILRDRPDVSKAPREVQRLLLKCLEKDPKQRLRDIGDAWDLLDDQNESSALPASPTARAHRLAWAGWALALVVGVGAGAMYVTRGVPVPDAPAETTWLNLSFPSELPYVPNGLHRSATITPDGRSLVYVSRDGIAVRRLDASTPTLLPGTEGGRAPFVSLDGQRVGFVRETSDVVWMSIRGGPLTRLVRASDVGNGGFEGATFLPDGGIIFATAATAGLMRVAPGQTAPQRLTSVDSGRSERLHQWPAALPNGRGALFTISSGLTDRPTMEVAVLDLTTGKYRVLLPGTQPSYIDGGYLAFVQDGSLFVAGFDDQRLELTSPAVPLGNQVATVQLGAAEYSVSRTGTLAMLPGPLDSSRSLVWRDRSGRETPLAAPKMNYVYPRVSPDGTRIAVDVRLSNAQSGYIGVYDIAKQVLARLSLGSASAQYPVWRPDSRAIYYQVPGAATMVQALDGGTAATINGEPSAPLSIDPAGRALVSASTRDGLRWLSIVSLAAPGDARTLMKSESAWIINGEISPDGRFLAFQSTESGRYEVFVVPFPDVTTSRWQISAGGGTRPAWSRDARELFFLDLSGTMMRVQTSLQPSFSAGTPERLFASAASLMGFPPGRNYDVAPDGRFLLIKDQLVNPTRPLDVTIALDWTADVRARVGKRE